MLEQAALALLGCFFGTGSFATAYAHSLCIQMYWYFASPCFMGMVSLFRSWGYDVLHNLLVVPGGRGGDRPLYRNQLCRGIHPTVFQEGGISGYMRTVESNAMWYPDSGQQH